MTDIYIIEDNSIFRSTLAKVLEKEPTLTCSHTFECAEDALKKITEAHLLPDIILLDIGLPGMSGIDLIPYLRKILPKTKIIILTIHEDNQNVFNAICAGAAGYLLKDDTAATIIESIANVINGGAPMNSQIARKVLQMFHDFIAPTGNYSLSNREKEILQLLVDGLSKNSIAEKLYISFHTVDTHLRNIYAKLEVHSRSGAVSKALRENLLRL